MSASSPAITEIAQRARAVAATVSTLPTDTKNAVLRDLAARLRRAGADIQKANEQDVRAARDAGVGEAKIRRLTLTSAAIEQMGQGLGQVAELDDPVGQVTRQYTTAGGLIVSKVRASLGVIMMIYEARPNVTVDAFALCLKAGNACILKGGREAQRSNRILAQLAGEALARHDVPADALALLTTSDRNRIKVLLDMHEFIDLVIPRGGAELIRFVHAHSRIPTVQHFHGICHVFVDASADEARALEICTSAKTSAPATCNSVETILVHEDIAASFVPRLADRMTELGVEIRGDEACCALTDKAIPATAQDWGHEFLDLVVALKVIPDVRAAISHIETFGSNHTDAILTTNEANARLFTEAVQSSCVLVNASTRFNDGFQLGLGAEIGISTSKIHAYGPMGLEELTTQRYVVRGDWHTR